VALKNDDVAAAITAIQEYQSKPSQELAIKMGVAMKKVPGVWIAVGGVRFRAVLTARGEMLGELLMEPDPDA